MMALALTTNAALPAVRLPPAAFVRSHTAVPLTPRLMLYREREGSAGEICMTIRQLLKNKGSYVPSVRSDATIRDVLDKLDLEDVGALVVTDDNEKILGLISERDIARVEKRWNRGDRSTGPEIDVERGPHLRCQRAAQQCP